MQSGYYVYDTHDRRRSSPATGADPQLLAVEHLHRRRRLGNLPVPGDPGQPAADQRLRRQQVDQPHRCRTSTIASTSTPTSRCSSRWRASTVQVRLRARAARQRRRHGRAGPTITLAGTRRVHDRGRPDSARHLRLLHRSRRRYTHGKCTRTTGVLSQDAWTINSNLTINFGVRTENEDIPSYNDRRSRASSSASATRSRRASASPTTSRATASGRPTAAGASSTTSRSSRCRAARWAPTTGQLLLHARHLQLAVRSTAGSRTAAARAPSSSRSTSGTSDATTPTDNRADRSIRT